MTPTDERLARVLLETRSIAMIGASLKPERASHRVGTYLAENGYRVIPVNPGHVGKTLFGQTVVASLADIDGPVDMLNVFRNSDAVLPVVEEGIATLDKLASVWMQRGIENADARALAESRGLTVVEDRCLATEHRRLLAPRV